MIMVLGIQAHGDDDFVLSFSVKLIFVAYFQLKIPKALVDKDTALKLDMVLLCTVILIHTEGFY